MNNCLSDTVLGCCVYYKKSTRSEHTASICVLFWGDLCPMDGNVNRWTTASNAQWIQQKAIQVMSLVAYPWNSFCQMFPRSLCGPNVENYWIELHFFVLCWGNCRLKWTTTFRLEPDV